MRYIDSEIECLSVDGKAWVQFLVWDIPKYVNKFELTAAWLSTRQLRDRVGEAQRKHHHAQPAVSAPPSFRLGQLHLAYVWVKVEGEILV